MLPPSYFDVFGCDSPDIKIDATRPVVICVVRNEALRLPYFLQHHRAIGVRQFFIIDDGSQDATPDILNSAPDVIRISARGSFRDHKRHWVSAVANTYLNNRWALFLDADELLVYPGWPDRSLIDLVTTLEKHGEEAFFVSLVDMYGYGDLDSLNYLAGAPFLSYCPLFDSEGYILVPRDINRREDLTPPEYIIGGTRQRLFFEKRAPNYFERTLIRKFFSLERRHNLGHLQAPLAWVTWRAVKSRLAKARPAMSKVPLFRWQLSDEICKGYHSVRRAMTVSKEWGSLLHFKYLQDFESRAINGAVEGQLGFHYRHYQDRLMTEKLEKIVHARSRRFEGVQSLIEVGLMRERSH